MYLPVPLSGWLSCAEDPCDVTPPYGFPPPFPPPLSAVLGLAERRGGAPIRDGLLAAAIEHLLSIDVEIRWEDIVDVPTGLCVPGGEG